MQKRLWPRIVKYLAVDYPDLLREHEPTVKYFLDLFQTSRRLALGYKQVNANGRLQF
jgi:hypothetical protein